MALARSALYGVATRSKPAGQPVTAIRRGVLTGWTGQYRLLDDELRGTPAGEITVTSSESNGGSADVIIGRVIPIWDHPIGGSPEKALLLTL